MSGNSTLAFRPASTVLSAAPSAVSVSPAPPGPVTNFSNVLATLPPIGDVMPPLALRKGIWELPHEDDQASHFAWAGLGVQDPAQRSVYFATGVTKLDREVQEMKSGAEKTNEDVISNHGYVESLRHRQKLKNLWMTGLVRLIKEHGTPELKAGVSFSLYFSAFIRAQRSPSNWTLSVAFLPSLLLIHCPPHSFHPSCTHDIHSTFPRFFHSHLLTIWPSLVDGSRTGDQGGGGENQQSVEGEEEGHQAP